MGRYYNGDIEGKFWFGVQSSTDADHFGVEGEIEVDDDGEETGCVFYSFSQDDLPAIQAGVDECLGKLGEMREKLWEFFSDKDAYTYDELEETLGIDKTRRAELLEWYARLMLGLQILECVKENGTCDFSGEL